MENRKKLMDSLINSLNAGDVLIANLCGRTVYLFLLEKDKNEHFILGRSTSMHSQPVVVMHNAPYYIDEDGDVTCTLCEDPERDLTQALLQIAILDNKKTAVFPGLGEEAVKRFKERRAVEVSLQQMEFGELEIKLQPLMNEIHEIVTDPVITNKGITAELILKKIDALKGNERLAAFVLMQKFFRSDSGLGSLMSLITSGLGDGFSEIRMNGETVFSNIPEFLKNSI